MNSWHKLRPMSEVIAPRRSSSGLPADAKNGAHINISSLTAGQLSEADDYVGDILERSLSDYDLHKRAGAPRSISEGSSQLDRRRSRPASWAVSQTSSPPSSLHPSSITPFIPQQPAPPPLPPNKLVKRTSPPQVRSISIGQASNEWSSKRPITSRQRSALLASGGYEGHENSRSDPEDKHACALEGKSKSYRHYFQVIPTIDKASGTSGSRLHKNTSLDIRQVEPHATRQPVLLLGNAVESPLPKEGNAAYATERFKRQSKRFSTATILDYQFSAPTSPLASSAVDSQSTSRRSFSIADLLSLRKTSDGFNTPRRRLQRPLSQRITSAPPGPSPASSGTRVIGSTVAVTYKPTTTGLTSSQSSEIPATQLRGESPTLPRVSEPESTMEDSPTLTQSGLRPYSGLHDSPTTSQYSSSFEPQSSRSQRSRRSVTPSEFASSNLGSDAECRVFSDDEDADMQSDTAYDSVKTGIMRRSDIFPGITFEKDLATDSDHTGIDALPRQSLRSSPIGLSRRNEIIAEEEETPTAYSWVSAKQSTESTLR